jgi:tagaturonate reductase
MRNELAPSIPYEIDDVTKEAFIAKVLDRFRNPHINHPWKNITLNYTSKIRMRCIPLLLNFYKINKRPPVLFSLGFAAYLYFMKGVKQNGPDVYGEKNGQAYLIDDPMAKKFYDLWQHSSVEAMVNEVLKDESLWGTNLSILPGFETMVTNDLKNIMNDGMKVTLEKSYSKKDI